MLNIFGRKKKEIVELKKLCLEPSDVLVIKCTHSISQQTVTTITENAKRIFGSRQRVIVLDSSMDIVVCSQAPQDSLREALRSQFVELVEAVHSMRGDVSRTWQEEFPEIAATLAVLDEGRIRLSLGRDGECQACGGKGCKHCDARALAIDCRQAGPGKGFCDMCAAGRYDRCRYIAGPWWRFW